MAQQLEQIIAELNNVYDPQRQTKNQQLEAIDPALQAEEQGLQAAKQDSFGQINDQANRRGMFYSGMPIAEEQRYTGSTYLPALANLRGKYTQQGFNLKDALSEINAKQYGQANDIWQGQKTADEEQRRWQAQFDQTAASQRASAGGGVNPSFNLGGGGNTTKNNVAINPADQLLFNQMFVKSNGQAWDDQALVSDYNATLKSANYGNAADQRKIQFYHTFQPGLFGASVPAFGSAKPATVSQPNFSGGPNAAVNFATGPLRR